MLYRICIPQKEETVLLEMGSTLNWVIKYFKKNTELAQSLWRIGKKEKDW